MGIYLAVCARLKGMKKIKRVLLRRFLSLALAERIEYEWNEEYIKEAFLGKDKLLPDDLYIFDICFIWLLVLHMKPTRRARGTACHSEFKGGVGPNI